VAEFVTAAQAGALCVNDQSPNGVQARTYRYYVRRLGAPDTVGRDTETGAKLYDAEAVLEWHASRPGRGYRTDLDKEKQ
jgi:hypothetical protein